MSSTKPASRAPNGRPNAARKGLLAPRGNSRADNTGRFLELLNNAEVYFGPGDSDGENFREFVLANLFYFDTSCCLGLCV